MPIRVPHPHELDLAYAIRQPDSISATGFEDTSFRDSTGNTLHLTVGNQAFAGTEKVDFGIPFCGFGRVPCPATIFFDGVFDGFNFIGLIDDPLLAFIWTGPASVDLFDWVGLGSPDGFDGAEQQETAGIWDLESAYLAVPEPTSLALLSPGLVGMGLRRRKVR